MYELSTPADVARRFTSIMGWLQGAIAARGGRDRVFALIVPLLWNYLGRAARRFEALARRIEAGSAAVKPRAPRPEPSEPSEPRPRKPGPFPTGHGWLIRIEQQTAISAADLKEFFRKPAFLAFLEAAPQATRILGPLCQMLGISRDADLPPALLRSPRTRAPKPPSPERPPARTTPSQKYRPLPRRYRLNLA